MIWLFIGGAIVCAALVLLATSTRLKIREYTVSSPKLSRSFTAVHISDLHESRYGKNQKKLIDAVKEANPDVIFITGDIIEDNKNDEKKPVEVALDNPSRVALEELVKIALCYMVLGNHEGSIPNIDDICTELEAIGVKLMHRASCEEIFDGVLLCGIFDPYFLRDEIHHNSLTERFAEDKDKLSSMILEWREILTQEFAFVAEDERFTILLSHRPEEYELYDSLGFDAAFSGHAHGGQWRLPPFINGVYAPHQGIFPDHAGGLYEYDGFVHVVSRGLSKKRMVRIFNRPEICVVEFKADTASPED